MKTIRVKASPNARDSVLEGPDVDGLWLARLKSPPVGGKANAELVKLLAKHFGCSKKAVTIKSGTSGRLKRVQIDDG